MNKDAWNSGTKLNFTKKFSKHVNIGLFAHQHNFIFLILRNLLFLSEPKQTTTRKCPKVERSLNLPGSPTLKELPSNKNNEPKIEIITSVDDHSPLRNISLPNNFINHKLSLLFTFHFTKYQIISNKHRKNNVNY